jgi:hypothetical protein
LLIVILFLQLRRHWVRRLKRSLPVPRLMRGKHGDEDLQPTRACPQQIVLLADVTQGEIDLLITTHTGIIS